MDHEGTGMFWAPVTCALALLSLPWAPFLHGTLSLLFTSIPLVSFSHYSELAWVWNCAIYQVYSQTLLHLGLTTARGVTFISQMRLSDLPVVKHSLTAEPRLTRKAFYITSSRILSPVPSCLVKSGVKICSVPPWTWQSHCFPPLRHSVPPRHHQ